MIGTLLNFHVLRFGDNSFVLFKQRPKPKQNNQLNFFLKDHKSIISSSLTNKNNLFWQTITSKLWNMKKKFSKGSAGTCQLHVAYNIKMLYLQ